MNITFLIGNGFDIKLGLKTRYTDFYDLYIESNKKRKDDDCIKKFCNMLEGNYETWADFEKAFAEKARGTKNEIRDILYDFSSKFADYLKTQNLLCDYSDSDIPAKFKKFLISGYTVLEDRDKMTIQKIYDSIRENININFVNFNYTNTLEKLISRYKENNSNSGYLRFFRHPNSSNQFVESIGKTLNIHGNLDSYIIIGIDSEEQFSDDDLKKNSTIGKYCVKSKMNEDVGNSDKETEFVNIINSSTIIYSYGISFGQSDKSRWNVVANWLKANNEHKLIIYKYKTHFGNYNLSYRRRLLDAIDEAKNEYLGLLGFDESEYEKYYDQIFVIDSDNVLDINLITNKHETSNEAENTFDIVAAG